MTGRIVRYLVVFALVCALALPLTLRSARADTFRLTIGSGHPPVAIWIERYKDFFAVEVKKRVEERTKHKIDWVFAFGGSVAKVGENLEAVQDGLLDVGYPLHQFEITKLFLHNFTNYVPFASADTRTVTKIADHIFRTVPHFQEVFEKKYNQKWINGGASDSYHLITKFPVKTLDDLKGHKIAAAGPNLTWLQGLAVPVQSNLNEAYTSLQTGVYEGWIMFVDASVGFKLYDQAKYYTFCDFGCVYGGSITMNMQKWNSLPKEVQDIFLEVGNEYQFDLADAIVKKRAMGVELMKKNGVEVTTLPFEERVKWANRLPNVPQQMADEAEAKGMPGKQVFKMYIDGLVKEGHKFPRLFEVK